MLNLKGLEKREYKYLSFWFENWDHIICDWTLHEYWSLLLSFITSSKVTLHWGLVKVLTYTFEKTKFSKVTADLSPPHMFLFFLKLTWVQFRQVQFGDVFFRGGPPISISQGRLGTESAETRSFGRPLLNAGKTFWAGHWGTGEVRSRRIQETEDERGVRDVLEGREGRCTRINGPQQMGWGRGGSDN